ncbi:MAG: MFS transporter, partial [Myxococcota bacterium]
MNLTPSARSFRLMLAYQVSQHSPLYWPYMFLFITNVRGLAASDFGLLKSIYYFTVMSAEVPLGVVADRLGRRTTLLLGALVNSGACVLYATGRSFAAFAVAELMFAVTTALQSGADSALLFDAYAADGRTHEFGRAMGTLESTGLAGATVAFTLAGLLVTRDGDPTLTYVASAVVSLVGVGAAFALREPPRTPTVRVHRHVAEAFRDLVHAPGLAATLAYGALVYAAIRGANALLWNPVLERAGVPVAAFGALTAVVTLLGAFIAWRADAWRRRVGTFRLAFAVASSLAAMYVLLALAPGSVFAAPLLLTHGFALGVTPVILADQMNRRIHVSERRATLLSFESLFQRGFYGVVVIAASAALGDRSLATVLAGFALLSAIPLALAARLRAEA